MLSTRLNINLSNSDHGQNKISHLSKHYKMVFVNMCKVFMKCSSVTHLCLYCGVSVAGSAGEEAGVGGHRRPAGEIPGGEPSPAAGERRPHRDPIQTGERAGGCCSKVLHSLTPLRRPRSQKHCFWFASLLKDTFYIYKVLGPC